LHGPHHERRVVGPVAIVNALETEDEALAEANRLPYGLAAYLYTSSFKRVLRLAAEIAVGALSVNGQGICLAQAPFGGVRDSGFVGKAGSKVWGSTL
jgi:succinate-semialdehyde dehydrogenase/glutarate-semialdehyde dehydrogenase